MESTALPLAILLAPCVLAGCLESGGSEPSPGNASELFGSWTVVAAQVTPKKDRIDLGGLIYEGKAFAENRRKQYLGIVFVFEEGGRLTVEKKMGPFSGSQYGRWRLVSRNGQRWILDLQSQAEGTWEKQELTWTRKDEFGMADEDEDCAVRLHFWRTRTGCGQ
ncbi:MAG: hypothetical protein HY720_10315 [Planctomycetes bacterium]|nr:hypothetical protein [Planctomycetota bacterium]